MRNGKLHLIPNLLSEIDPSACIPDHVKSIALALKYYVVENEKVSRRLLKKLDRDVDIDSIQFFVLDKRNDGKSISSFLTPALNGHDIGLMSDAGCPAVADPGSDLVRLAHEQGVLVVPHVGPSSILMTVMSAGMNGQAFTFNGYLPKERKDRIAALKKMEDLAVKRSVTQLFMDTPYRNDNVIEDLLKNCRATTRLCIASDLTGEHEKVRTLSIEEWRKRKLSYNKIPVMFALGS